MIIIVEGIDRIGKTTLCKKLSERLGFPIYKEEGVHEKSQEGNRRSQMALLSLCEITDCNVIFDRLFVSELVYGMIDRGCDEGKSWSIFWEALAKCLKIKNVVYIGMNPTDVEKSSNEHGEDLLRHVQCFSEANKKVKEYVADFKGTNYVNIDCKYEDIQTIVDNVYKLYLEVSENGK